MMRGIRGATTVEKNEATEIERETERLLRKMVADNEIQPEHIAQVLVTVTDDIDACFPAKALRNLKGFDFVPVMCAQEIPVKGSLPRCIRVMMTAQTDQDQQDVCHTFLNQAITLRPDLLQKG
ncbi:chorismate mutase [Shouchella lehensis]|uniref:chorismate mutase n=1 Tax=Shouchella lehensis TaxID=300825 RepID=A0A4Y7WPT0_9BACI|nr:chorismate mutase [Shouchella lehensis]MBG9784504.1 chorismate mutase [Shouchella lehensis]TES50490.1 chorismate mutase [Shouchella lehensis]